MMLGLMQQLLRDFSFSLMNIALNLHSCPMIFVVPWPRLLDLTLFSLDTAPKGVSI